MPGKRLLLLLNPKAGQKKAARLLSEIINLFNQVGCTVIVHVSQNTWDSRDAVIKYADEVDFVVCCGGDGTFNETLSGVLQCGKDLPIGYIPAGSTNDFAAGLSLSSDILQAARDIIEGEPTELDVGEFNGRYFSYIASFGLFTKTSYSTPQELKNALGHAAYILSGIQEISQIKTHRLTFELDNGETFSDDYIFGAVSNSTSFGGVLTLSKDQVDLRDGKLELLLIRQPKDILELAGCVVAIQQHTYNSPMITFMNAKSLRITAPGDLDWTLDGEKEAGREDISIRCLQRAIRIIQKNK